MYRQPFDGLSVFLVEESGGTRASPLLFQTLSPKNACADECWGMQDKNLKGDYKSVWGIYFDSNVHGYGNWRKGTSTDFPDVCAKGASVEGGAAGWNWFYSYLRKPEWKDTFLHAGIVNGKWKCIGYLYCSKNKLTSLNLSKAVWLTELTCDKNVKVKGYKGKITRAWRFWYRIILLDILREGKAKKCLHLYTQCAILFEYE